MPEPKVAIVGISGNKVDVTENNRLKVEAELSVIGDVNIGNVDVHLNGGVPLLGNVGDVAAGVLRVTLANNDPAVTALQLIDDAIYVDDADWDGTSKHMLVGGLYGSNTITSGDVGPIALAEDGAVHISHTALTNFSTAFSTYADKNQLDVKITDVGPGGVIEVLNDGAFQVQTTNILVPAEYNMMHLGYTGDDLTEVRYFTGATNSADPPANSTLVTTLALAYTDNVLDSILRTDA